MSGTPSRGKKKEKIMTLTLKIDNDESTTEDQIKYLYHVAEKLKQGDDIGINWEITGFEEEVTGEEQGAWTDLPGYGEDGLPSE